MEIATFRGTIRFTSFWTSAPRDSSSLSPGARARCSAAFLLASCLSLVASMESGSSEELVKALSLCRVPETLSTQIAQAYETPSDFTFAFPQLQDLNRLLEDIDEDTKRAIGLEPDALILASLPASRLRKAVKMC